MDDSLFAFSVAVFFICIMALIYCFLSTCIGQHIRRSEVWDALFPSHAPRSSSPQSLQRNQYHYNIDRGLVWDHDHRSPSENIEMMPTPSSRYHL
ncbi:hypothetical protein CspeluHIS016_0102390 [Cutaneotrichosporon spelunceum]|uniref:Uncharacterized protein n=1 Tax=Cutaneotrichosporon spelunceum TaxID=1672016 RepID=A0AAD3TM96_9TREE|nr:hypothetical protein CspeluHIS016_0102390 [Cutaneotrichosporon spelunceum]